MTTYADLSAAGLTLGQVVGGNSVKRTFLEATADNLLKISGTSTSTACRLQGLANPQNDDEAANKVYVQNYVMSQIRGLQLKQSVALCSTSNVNLQGARPTTQHLWAGPYTKAGGTANRVVNLLTLPDDDGRTLGASDYLQTSSGKFTFAAVWRYSGASIIGGVPFFLNMQFNGSSYGNYFFFGGNSVLQGGCDGYDPPHFDMSYGDFPADTDIYVLYSYDRATQTNTWRVGKLINGVAQDVSGGGNGYVSPCTRTGNVVGGNGSSYTLQSLSVVMQNSAPTITVKNILVTNDVLTLDAALGTAAWAPLPAGWTTVGIDGVVPSANTRVLLTGQTDGKQNGLWQVDSTGTSLVRPVDFAAGSSAGACFVFVNGSGSSNDDKGFYCTTTPGQDVVDTNSTAWTNYTTGGGALGTLTVGTDTITTASGTLSLNNNSLTTTGTVTGTQHTSGTLTLSQGSLVDSSGSISMGSTSVTTSGTVSAGTLTLSAGSLVDSSGSLSLGSTSVTTTGTVTSSHFYSSSDARLKEVLGPLSTQLEDLPRLAPVHFKWKESGKEDTGLIAQDVQEVAPECVTESEGFLKVDYARLVPYLIKWVQELFEIALLKKARRQT